MNQSYSIVFKELEAFVNFIQSSDGINWKVFVRLMNRHRKTGTYIKLDQQNIDAGIFNIGSSLIPSEPVDEYDDYGGEGGGGGGDDYEGGEAEDAFPDIDKELAK